MAPSMPPTTVRRLREHGLLRLLRAVHETGASRTRAELTRELVISRSAAAALVADLARRRLAIEVPTPGVTRPGRPTATLSAHPLGPVVLVADVTHAGWRLESVEIGGRRTTLGSGSHGRGDARAVLAAVDSCLAAARAVLARRAVAIAVAVPGTISGTRVVQAVNLGWEDVAVADALATGGISLLVGNDATFAGVAEARHGAACGARVALHLHVGHGVGGVLLAGGSPVPDAQGAGGEFGHLPFGRSDRRCRCGARGCWDLEVDGRALVRETGARLRAGSDAAAAGTRVLSRAAAGDAAARRAARTVAAAFGRGVAGLVNAHDPELVTVSGTGAEILAAAPAALSEHYRAGLMRFRRDDPPAIRPTLLGDTGRCLGAADLAFDHFLTPAGLSAWGAG